MGNIFGEMGKCPSKESEEQVREALSLQGGDDHMLVIALRQACIDVTSPRFQIFDRSLSWVTLCRMQYSAFHPPGVSPPVIYISYTNFLPLSKNLLQTVRTLETKIVWGRYGLSTNSMLGTNCHRCAYCCGPQFVPKKLLSSQIPQNTKCTEEIRDQNIRNKKRKEIVCIWKHNLWCFPLWDFTLWY